MTRRRVDPFKLAIGGHVLVPCRHPDTYRGAPLYRCTRCHGITPRWSITTGWFAVFIGRHCPELLPAIPPTSYRPRSVS